LGGDAAVAKQQANIIYPLMLTLIAQRAGRGHNIGRDADGFYARRRSSTAGPVRELRDLKGAARKAAAGKLDTQGWLAAVAKVPPNTLRRIWKPSAPLRGAYVLDAPGLHMLAPNPADMLPGIDAELARLKTTPPAERRLRKRDAGEQAAIDAIRSAYRAITGKKGGRVIDPHGKPTGKLYRLGREIDEIFGARLYAEKDSRRRR
jgi:hypothetical protein